MATIRRGKAVILTRHVERPRIIVANHQHHHHHHHVHHTIKREVIHYRRGADGKRFINRRAELLQYSKRLRESARLPALTPSLPMPISSNNHQYPENKVVNARRKPKDGGTPTCLGNCKLTIPNFFKLLSFQVQKKRIRKMKNSASTSNKIKAALKSLEGQKKHGFFSKLLST
ncbi:hypothetical protein PanWU01x14_123560 [Parasponia andersonii]|uniref:Uncharacterized protein n=1 Tax=Parasponia andersonii TaxID=3476 RepID=A0A2P5CUA5_PARAD|nr:hypothetical protein PanWU01x14_123560 [Parasponia andersonii]